MSHSEAGLRRLSLADPRFGDAAVSALAEVVASGCLTQGPTVASFEEAIAAYCGVDHAIATTSATTALHLAVVALDLGPGDEVIVPDFTYPATANVVLQQGARLLLVDVDPFTYNIDPVSLQRALTDATRLVIAVDLFGLAADYRSIVPLLAERGIPLLCDAACGLGAEVDGQRCGAIGHAACFSFHPRKVLTTGEGGMVTPDDGALAQRLRRLRNHGAERNGWRSQFVEAGFNYRLSELQAALGLVQVPHHDAVVNKRGRLAARLSQLLEEIEGITTPAQPYGYRHAFQAYVARLADGVDQARMIEMLRASGIEATLGTYALHAEPVFRDACGTRPGDLPVSFALTNQTLALPLHERLEEADMARVAEAVAGAIAQS